MWKLVLSSYMLKGLHINSNFKKKFFMCHSVKIISVTWPLSDAKLLNSHWSDPSHCHWYKTKNIWFAIQRLNKYILYAKGLSNDKQATQSVKWNEMYKWKDDMKYPERYEPEQLCAQD